MGIVPSHVLRDAYQALHVAGGAKQVRCPFPLLDRRSILGFAVQCLT
jgi:hypothetical protein